MKMSSRQDKATFYRHKTQLNELVARPENKHCADCKKHAPRWASWNIGVFICLRCSVIHRTLGAYISKVKSLDSDVWIPDQIALLTIWGNARANLYWEARLKTERVPPEHKIESFIRNKYELRRWAMDGQPPSDPSVLEQGAEELKAEAEPAESVALTSSSTPPHSTNSSVSSCSAHSLPSPTITTVSPQTPSVTSSDKEHPISTSSKQDHVKRGKDTEIVATEIAHLDIGEIDLTGKIDQGRQITWGNYSDVWHGTLLKDDGKAEVAIKALRVRHSTNRISKTPNEERLYKRFYREALLWAKLRHPNVTPLLGYTLDPDGVPSLVSPWYPNGNLIEYLTSHPNANRSSLVSGITKALQYLHSIPVVHGDIKGENVLVDSDGSARLCDFGMAQLLDEALQITGYTTSMAYIGGTDRYFTPELLDEEPKTTMSDIWAFGCLVMLTLTGQPPYQHLSKRVGLFNAIMRGDLPYKKPEGVIQDSLWNSLVRCWNFDPKDRPSISDLAAHLCEGECI